MGEKAIENGSAIQVRTGTPLVTLINVFTPKPGQTEAFCEAQIAEYRRLSGKIEGALNANLHRSVDGRLAANYAQYASLDAYNNWRESDLFAEHLKIIAPYLEKVEPVLYKVEFTQIVEWESDAPDAAYAGVRENDGGAILRVGDPVVTLINRFTPKPGKLQAFCDAQIAEYRRLRDQVRGVVSTNLHVNLDRTLATNYAQFESMEAYKAWVDGPLFQPHLEIIRPLLDKVEPALYELVFTLHGPGSRFV